MGCAKPEYCGAVPEPRRRARHTPFNCATLARLIAFSAEYRWLYRLPPFVGQPEAGSAVSLAAEKPGVAPRLMPGVPCATTKGTNSAATAADSAAEHIRMTADHSALGLG